MSRIVVLFQMDSVDLVENDLVEEALFVAGYRDEGRPDSLMI